MSRIESITDMKHVYADIRAGVPDAGSRRQLTTLYRQASSVITHSFAPTWKKKYGDKLPGLRKTAESEFRKTARAINRRAKQLGTDADYDEEYGK